MVDPEKLKRLADRLYEMEGRGAGAEGLLIEAVEALRDAAAEIETLEFTVKATVQLAQRASMQAILDRTLFHGLQDENSRLHERNTDLTYQLQQLQSGSHS